MNEQGDNPERAARLARALRENLRRRKAQIRGRRGGSGDGADRGRAGDAGGGDAGADNDGDGGD